MPTSRPGAPPCPDVPPVISNPCDSVYILAFHWRGLWTHTHNYSHALCCYLYYEITVSLEQIYPHSQQCCNSLSHPSVWAGHRSNSQEYLYPAVSIALRGGSRELGLAVPQEWAEKAELGAVMLAGLPALHTLSCPPVTNHCRHPWAVQGCRWGWGELLCLSHTVQHEWVLNRESDLKTTVSLAQLCMQWSWSRFPDHHNMALSLEDCFLWWFKALHADIT